MDLSRLGPFAIEQRLGGPHSCVYRAVHIEQRKPAALKVFPIPFLANDEARRSFLRECEALKRLRHPGVVRCYGGGIEERVAYLAFELIDGETLDDLLLRRGRLPWDLVVGYGLQLCAALEFAHGRELIHTALSPEKILVSERRLKIADFRTQRGGSSVFQTSGAEDVLRRRYWAPEQFRGEPITHRTDLYALGCVLYHMLVGQPPFIGSPEEVEQGHLHRSPPRVATEVLDCPVWLDALVRQMLHKIPEKRPYTAVAVGLALKETRKNVVEGASVVGHAAGGISALRTGVSKSAAQKILGTRWQEPQEHESAPFYERAWFLALCLIAVLSLGAWLLWPPGPQKLLDRAETLLASGEDIDAYQARDKYLSPLVQRNPEAPQAETARRLIDEIDMRQAENRLRARLRLGRTLDSEQERLLAEAWKYDQFGDRVSSLEKYQSMATLLAQGSDAEDPEVKPFLNIARRRVEELMSESSSPGDRAAFLQERLQKAEQLQQSGQALEAQQIWRSIETLYRGNRELQPLVDQARKRLDETAAS